MSEVLEEFKIVGMHCATCSVTVESAIKKLGVKSVSVNLATEEAVVEHQGLSAKQIVEAIRQAGYDVLTAYLLVELENVSEDEISYVSNSLEKTKGVIEVTPNYVTHSLKIEYNPYSLGATEIEDWLRKRGYSFKILQSQVEESSLLKREFSKYKKRLVVGSVFGALSLVFYLLRFELLSLVSVLPVQLYSGSIFYRGAYRALKNKTSNMDTLVSLSSGVAFAYALYSFLQYGISQFIDVAALLIPFILVGRTLELSIKTKMVESVSSIAQKSVSVIRDGKAVTVDQASVKVGDLVLVKPGESIPVDGVVEEGKAEVNEAILTGEAKPVIKQKGSAVISGSTVISGSLLIYATRVGSRAYVNRVAEFVKQARGAKLPIQRTVDKLSSVFTPIVVVASFLTFSAWFFVFHVSAAQALLFSLSVLAVSCPCALGLATPLAISAAINKAAKSGIVVKRGEALEKASKLDIVLFDKTGTLTEDEFTVVGYKELVPGALSYAAVLEKRSEHPYAKAIVKRFLKDDLEPTEFESFAGEGVAGVVLGKKVVVGERRFVESNCETPFPIENHELSTVFVALDGKPAAVVTLDSKIRENAKQVVEWLKKNRIRVCIVTGDSEASAKRVAKEVGIEEVYAGLKPWDKAQLVTNLKKEGVVMFVGDGVNDAQALSASDIGVAFGTDIAKAIADIALAQPNLKGVIKLIKLSQRTVSKVKQNLGWAFGYNALLIPIAAGALFKLGFVMRPEFAALAMSLSSVFVSLWSRTV